MGIRGQILSPFPGQTVRVRALLDGLGALPVTHAEELRTARIPTRWRKPCGGSYAQLRDVERLREAVRGSVDR